MTASRSGRSAAVTGAFATGVLLAAGDIARVAIRNRLDAASCLWLTLVALGIYAVLATGTALVLPYRDRAAGVAGTLLMFALMVSVVQIRRRWLRVTPPEVGSSLLDAALRLLASGGLWLLAYWVVARLGRPPRDRSAATVAILALVLGAAATIAVAVEASRNATLAATVLTTSPAPDGGMESPTAGLVLVVIDTLRADRLGAYGQLEPITPHLDRLARAGVTFAQSFSQASWTKPSTASILTSLYPTAHGAGPQGAVLADAITTLPEVLARHGYLNLGFSANGSVAPVFGLDQGFQEFHYLATMDRRLQAFYDLRPLKFAGNPLEMPIYLAAAYGCTADMVTDAVTTRARSLVSSRPPFLYVHYMDPHAPYFTPVTRRLSRRTSNYRGTTTRARAVYEQEIASTDHQVARLLRTLETLPPFRAATIAVTSDHGEEFYEHGHITHGHSLYEELLRVPLILDGPTIEPRLVTTPVSGIDVAPTLLAASSVPIPPEFQGHDARAAGGSEPILQEEAFGEHELRAIRIDGLKLIARTRPRPSTQLFDLAVDPRERHDLASADPAATARLTRALDDMERQIGRAEASPAAPTGAALDELRALGYVD